MTMTNLVSTESVALSPDNEKKYRAISTPIDGIITRVALRIGGKRAKEIERFLKFAVVGTIGAFVDLGSLNLLQATVLPPGTVDQPVGFTLPIGGLFLPSVAIAATISFLAAVTSNFTWNRFWTYPDSRSRSIRRQLTQFTLVSAIGWLMRTIWITLSYAFIGTTAVWILQSIAPSIVVSDEGVAKLGSNIATFMGIFVVMIWNFFANRYWTYNDIE